MTQAKPLSDLLDTLPVELLLEIVSHFDSGIAEEPRSHATSTFLLALMKSGKRFRNAARPVYWSEVQLSTKSQWTKLAALLRGNKFKKTPLTLASSLIRVLDLHFERTGEAFGGLDDKDIDQMIAALPDVYMLRISMNEQIRLVKPLPSGTYISRLAGFAKTVTSLAIYNTVTEPMMHVMQLIEKLPLLQTLLIDNVNAAASHNEQYVDAAELVLPNLTSFTIRNSPEIVFGKIFDFVRKATHLTKLVVRDTRLDAQFLHDLLDDRGEELVHLELGTGAPQPVIDREELYASFVNGTLSANGDFYYPIEMLQIPQRIGNEIIQYIPNIRHLALGGLLCVSSDIFEEIQESDLQLRTLSFFNAWPLRSLRPTSDHQQKAEQEAIAANPSGIAPGDVLAALMDRKLDIQRLDLVGMGVEWQTDKSGEARQVQLDCESRGIAFICR